MQTNAVTSVAFDGSCFVVGEFWHDNGFIDVKVDREGNVIGLSTHAR